ncbi:MAG: rod shape-determining protein MreC [Oscillospiraceae bacterium]|nr:rod shape-determining protein MreC [Oscillospiraceae bacterium]
MQDFFRSIWFKILLVITAILVGLIIFGASTGQLLAPEQILRSITQPVGELVTSINNAVADFFDQIFQSGKYKDENELLKEEILNMQNKILDYDMMKSENEQLKEAAEIKSLHIDFDIEPANIIAKDPDDLYSFTINKGAYHGIEVNNPVITKSYLVGTVTKVGEMYSEVTTILSPDVQISAFNSTNGETGIVSGQADLIHDGYCAMFHLERETAACFGDLVATSGAGSVYPANLIIGTVNEVKVNSNGMSSYAVLKPTEDIMALKNITVVKNFTGKGSKLPGDY